MKNPLITLQLAAADQPVEDKNYRAEAGLSASAELNSANQNQRTVEAEARVESLIARYLYGSRINFLDFCL